jgi:hypothetical protein
MGRRRFKMFGGVVDALGNTIADALPPMPPAAAPVVSSPWTFSLYVAYFFGGLLIFFIVFIIIITLVGKRDPPPPEDFTNSASGK